MQNFPGLGPLVAVYQTRRLLFRHFWGLILGGLTLILLPTAIGVYRFYDGYTRFGPTAGYEWGVPWLGFAGVAACLWLVLLVLRLRTPHYKVLLYKNGLQFDGLRSATKILGQQSCLDWESLSGVSVETIGHHSDTKRTAVEIASQKVSLYLSSGKKITLSETGNHPGGLINLQELASRIKACLYTRLAPKYRTAFGDGQWLSFGPVLVHKQGIHFQSNAGKKSQDPITWDQVRHITVKAGNLVVELGQPVNPAVQFKRIPASQIPNLELLLQLIKENVEG